MVVIRFSGDLSAALIPIVLGWAFVSFALGAAWFVQPVLDREREDLAQDK